MSKIFKSELCDSCLKIRQKMDNGSLSDTLEEWLDSKGYQSGNSQAINMMNLMAYMRLRNNKGCYQCIKVFEDDLLDTGYEQDYLDECCDG